MTGPGRTIRVLLADDHALVRAGIRALLDTIQGVQVVGEASDGKQALERIEELHPDLVLMDISMANLNGIEAVARARKSHPKLPILILSMHAAEEYALEALQAGATGYLLKEAAPAELEIAVRAVARGESYLSPAISAHVVKSVRRRRDPSEPETPEERSPAGRLTSRQREILQLIAEGHSTKEIASRLDLSVKTVETHRAQIMERLDIHDVAGLVRYAIRTGLISADR